MFSAYAYHTFVALSSLVAQHYAILPPPFGCPLQIPVSRSRKFNSKRGISFGNVMKEPIIDILGEFLYVLQLYTDENLMEQFVDYSQAIHFCIPCERIRKGISLMPVM
jgi:hypothetical protein